MVPITKDKVKKYTDEKSGIVYKFKYVTGAEHLELLAQQKSVSKNIKAVNALQKKVLELPDDEKEHPPSEISDGLIQSQFELFKYNLWLVDFFLVGWESETLKLPDLTEKPTAYFNPADINGLADVIKNFLPELTGAPIELAKN